MSQTDLSKYNNEWFRPGNKLLIVTWFIIGRLTINTYLPIPLLIKRSVLRLFGSKLGKNVVIKPKVNIKYPWFLEIDDNTWIGEEVWIDNLTDVKIGKNACISQGAMLLTGNHNYKKSSFDLIVGKIILEDGVWVGAKSVVCPGVTCQSHSVLSVNSVATQNLEAFSIYQGNPAIKIRVREMK
ncbi:MAG: WcaF family extracellular polysaccharide biosynthesis acetyltransferase [Spirosomaceae bacterium]|jgi:putative colanic acid biosynthesis acetyltransferase WcaF|nr:WcaF family extracellular polysaccharide biosynthesis acetyltransferase [Spirosomataceae bacterium]